MIGEILTGLNILEKLGKFWNWLRGQKQAAPAESVATRFIRLFESHDVHRNQIPRFFGHGLLPKDVQDDASLFAKLDEARFKSPSRQRQLSSLGPLCATSLPAGRRRCITRGWRGPGLDPAEGSFGTTELVQQTAAQVPDPAWRRQRRACI